MEHRLVVPVHAAEIQLRRDEANLVANPLGHERRLRVVENDAFLFVEQAGPLVDLGDDRVHTKRADPIPQHAVRAVERFALPHEQADSLRELGGEDRARRDDRRSLCRTVGNRPALGFAEQIVELLLRQFEECGDIDGHGPVLWRNRLSLQSVLGEFRTGSFAKARRLSIAVGKSLCTCAPRPRVPTDRTAYMGLRHTATKKDGEPNGTRSVPPVDYGWASARITSAAFSAITYTAHAMKKPGMRGNADASTTRRPVV